MRNIKSQQLNRRSRQPGKGRNEGISVVFIGLLVAIMAMTACSSHERRTTGTVLNDQNLEYEVLRNISANPAFGENDHIKVEVHQGVVLLAGETTSEEKRLLATSLAEKPRLADRVINDLKIGRRAGFGGKLDNAWLTTKVESILAAKNPIEGSDVRRIKVVSSQNTVYLMGLVTREEGEKIAEVVRNIGGVEKVVKVFDYTD
jgi:osmotically-inducible protein OsmY